MPPDDVAELRRLVLDHCKEAFYRGLTGESPAQVESIRVVYTPTACTPKVKSILYATEKGAWLSEQM